MDSKLMHIYYRGRLVKTHVRQPRGGRSTEPADYPAELSAYTTRAPDRIKASNRELDPAVADFADRLLEGPLPWAKLRQGHKLLRLGKRYLDGNPRPPRLRSVIFPTEAYSPLAVDPNAVQARSVPGESLQPVAGQSSQVSQGGSVVQYRER